jgi:ammonia channel protein AmtB
MRAAVARAGCWRSGNRRMGHGADAASPRSVLPDQRRRHGLDDHGRCAGIVDDRARMPSNLGYTMIGASLLWVGWMGFDGGSAGAADGRAGMAMLVTQLATAAAVLAWMAMEWIVRGTPTLLGLCSGAVAGLVAITPARSVRQSDAPGRAEAAPEPANKDAPPRYVGRLR